jgi:hypothetical protein
MKLVFDRKKYMIKYFREHKEMWDKSRLRRNLKSLYGLSIEQYDQLIKDQDGKCRICLRHVSNFRQRLNVDHDHITGKIRGLLCGPCNAALGIFQDNVENLKRAIAYLEYNSSKNTRQTEKSEDVLRPVK